MQMSEIPSDIKDTNEKIDNIAEELGLSNSQKNILWNLVEDPRYINIFLPVGEMVYLDWVFPDIVFAYRKEILSKIGNIVKKNGDSAAIVKKLSEIVRNPSNAQKIENKMNKKPEEGGLISHEDFKKALNQTNIKNLILAA